MELTIEDLKCCGNCCYRDRMDNGYNSEEWCMNRKEDLTESSRVCPKWEYDGVQNRRIE